MLWVILAMMPGLAVQFYYFGWGVIFNLLLSGATAIACEVLVQHLRERPLFDPIKDNSALVSGIILGAALPPLLPFWMVILGSAFAILFGKAVYGGLGNNPFNPAMIGYVLLLISFPVEMTAWLPSRAVEMNQPDFWQSLQLLLTGSTREGLTVLDFRQVADGFTQATPLDHFKTARSLGYMVNEIQAESNYLANIQAPMMVNLAYLLGGLILLARGIIRWHIPVAFFAGMVLTAGLINSFDEARFISPWLHLALGATMLGAFFIATDPVSAATTPKGRLIYGAMIGALVVIIRNFGGYPDAVAFAVLLLNIAAPTIDYYCKPVVYGEKSHDR
jgi:electron transport complex protein RnfD